MFPNNSFSDKILSPRKWNGRSVRIVSAAALALMLAACSGKSSPGPLEGTWRGIAIFVPVEITFRAGEMESGGKTYQVTYERDGDTINVKPVSPEHAKAERSFKMLGKDKMRSPVVTFTRVEK